MSLTPAQLGQLKAAVIADPVAGPMRTAGDSYSLKIWCNAASVTQAWRVYVTESEIYAAHKIKEYIGRSAPERSAFDLMVSSGRVHDFTVAKTRNGVADIFSGVTNNTSRTAIFAAAQEAATNAQVALGGAQVSVGGTADMAETITALKRTYLEEITETEVARLLV